MAAMAMPTVPATTDSLADLPPLLCRRDGHNVAHNLMTGDQGVLYLGRHAIFRHLVAIKHISASQHGSIDIQH